MSTLVVIPTYNEADNIGTAMDRVRAAVPAADILVVDDGSPDGTGSLVEARHHVDPQIHVLHRPGKSGLGASYRAGFGWGLDRRYDVLVEMDADLSHPADRIPDLLEALGHADVAIGSRYVAGGTTVGWPWSRRAISRLGNAYVSLALHLGVRDATAGFRAYRRHVLEAIEVDLVDSNGYCFQIEMTDRSRRAAFRVAEVPITFTERAAGQSKMSTGIVIEALWLVTRWGIRDRLEARSLRPERRLPRAVGTAVEVRPAAKAA